MTRISRLSRIVIVGLILGVVYFGIKAYYPAIQEGSKPTTVPSNTVSPTPTPFFTPSPKNLADENKAISYLKQKLQASHVKVYWLDTKCVTYLSDEDANFYNVEIHEYHNEKDCPGASETAPLIAWFRIKKSDNSITYYDIVHNKFISFNHWVAQANIQ